MVTDSEDGDPCDGVNQHEDHETGEGNTPDQSQRDGYHDECDACSVQDGANLHGWRQWTQLGDETTDQGGGIPGFSYAPMLIGLTVYPYGDPSP